MTVGSAILVGVHALVAWIAIEIFVNLAHGLSRASYVFWHYVVVVATFALVFGVYVRFFETEPPFTVTATSMGFVLAFEFIVFRFLYSGERWFLNWVDWILPLFLATTTIYVVVYLW
ncbi:hypothetical protein HY630_00990 [Candidatus Uhrbacteria bacterium]|nr:hypothetical protein [Candidatus Uhrbacteria bacterium]